MYVGWKIFGGPIGPLKLMIFIKVVARHVFLVAPGHRATANVEPCLTAIFWNKSNHILNIHNFSFHMISHALKWLTHARENLIWKYASILPKQVDNWIASLLDFPTWQLTMTVMLRWIYTDRGIKGKRLNAILPLAWMCYVRITNL